VKRGIGDISSSIDFYLSVVLFALRASAEDPSVTRKTDLKVEMLWFLCSKTPY
jgi:hypothetical protein